MRRGALAPLLCAALAAPAAAQQIDVTLTDAIQRSLAAQPAMVSAHGDVRNANATKRGAWGAFLPSVGLGGSALRSNTARFDPNSTELLPPGYSYTGSLTASLNLFDGFNRLFNVKASTAASDAASAGFVNQRYQTTLATQQAFFTALANAELVRVAQANVDRAKEEVQIAVNRFQAGAATRSDTLTATVDFGNARLAFLQAQSNLATAQANLARQIGVNGSARAVADSVVPQLLDTTGLRAAALASAPIVTQFEAQARAAGADIWNARSQYWPSLSVAYTNTRTGVDAPELPLLSNYRESFAWRFALTWTLFDGLQRERTQVSASTARDLANAQAADARRQVDAQLTQYLAAMFTAHTQIGIADANVAAATEARRVQQERYRLGAATLLDLLTAEANLTQAEVLQVQARYNYVTARAQVEALVGRTL
ncbi:MAG TPA: TolC family protein [Gemmatimonadales bacterium]|nr:TolC family protein [Gemmatimonadales bacterium]